MHHGGRRERYALACSIGCIYPSICKQNFPDAEGLTHQFHLTFNQAAHVRGISRRTMRNLRIERHITRWPSRTINSMRGKHKCSVRTAPVVPEHEPTSSRIVPMEEKKSKDTGARSDSLTVDDSTSWPGLDISADWDQAIAAECDELIDNLFADAPGARPSSPAPPPLSPPMGSAFDVDLDEFLADSCAANPDLRCWTLPTTDPTLPTADLGITL